jgi:uncharacterized protein YbjT (DUF2867 family)
VRVVVAAAADSRTGRLVIVRARRRGHRVRTLRALDDAPAVAGALRGANAVVLIPDRGDPERHAHRAARTLVTAAHGRPHLLLVSSFAVGHGPRHAFNRVMGTLPAMLAAEDALRASGLPYTIVRATWLTDDPPGSHALTLTQDPAADGMLSRADLAATLVAAIEDPAARGTTFAAFNQPGARARHWARAFAGLAPA